MAAEAATAMAEIQKVQGGRHWGGREGTGAVKCAPTCPVPLGLGELADPPSRDGLPHPEWTCSLQELALVRGVMGGMRA